MAYFLFSSSVAGLSVIAAGVILMWYSKRRHRDSVEEECVQVGSSVQYQSSGHVSAN